MAELAGVSKRTIDYYTNLGLITPVQCAKKYRYYSEETLARLRLIESMKKQRFTLEEIKQQLDLLDSNLGEAGRADSGDTSNLDYLKGQINQLENQLAQLQKAMANLDPNRTTVATKQVLFQGMTLVQSLMIYIDDLTSLTQL